MCASCTFEWGWYTMKPHFLVTYHLVLKDVCWNSFTHRQIFSLCASLYIEWRTLSWGFVLFPWPSISHTNPTHFLVWVHLILWSRHNEVNGPLHIWELLPFGTLLNVMLLFVVYQSQFVVHKSLLSCKLYCRPSETLCFVCMAEMAICWTLKTLLLNYHFLYWFITVLSITS